MSKIHTQVHGYLQGHQLLSSSINLSKSDQATVDQLSDVAGPLRPGERFAPYLSAYPLPSGTNYVVARTWQDLTVPRAGCVRTLSAIVPMHEWEQLDPEVVIKALDPGLFPQDATTIEINRENHGRRLPSLKSFEPDELLEAMFLEDAKPIVLFDAPEADLLATRLLTAFWPQLRAGFALSTFALSPRKIGGRFFDLVLAPADARSRFADWPGRRLDARMSRAPRHRWTESIVARVFDDPSPKLLGDRERRFLASAPTPAAGLRMSLRWEELRNGLADTPTNILGLLDLVIAARDPLASRQLTSEIDDAVAGAVRTLTARDAWDFLIALSRKLAAADFSSGRSAIGRGALALTRRWPVETIAILDEPGRIDAAGPMILDVAIALAERPGLAIEAALNNTGTIVLARLVNASPAFARALVASPILLEKLVSTIPVLPEDLWAQVRSSILPLLVSEEHVIPAQAIITTLDAAELLKEARLVASTDAVPTGYAQIIVARAQSLRAMADLRALLLDLPSGESRNNLLRASLSADPEDIRWLLRHDLSNHDLRETILLELLRTISEDGFRSLAGDRRLADEFLALVPDHATDILLRLALESSLPTGTIVRIVQRLLPDLGREERQNMARFALDRCLRESFDGDEIVLVSDLLNVLGHHLDGVKAIRIGLYRDVRTEVANRNMRAFDRCAAAARSRIVGSIEEMAATLAKRRQLDLDEGAAQAAARLLQDAYRNHPDAALRAGGTLLPSLMRADRCPVSSMIAVVFPPIYRELAREEVDVPEILKFVPFIDWDRCKTARHELVDAFLRSRTWDAGDLALTACRSAEVQKILRRTAKSYKGDEYVRRIANDLTRLPSECRQKVTSEIASIRTDPSFRFDWRA